MYNAEKFGLRSMSEQTGLRNLDSYLCFLGIVSEGHGQAPQSVLHSSQPIGTALPCLLLLPELDCRGTVKETGSNGQLMSDLLLLLQRRLSWDLFLINNH